MARQINKLSDRWVKATKQPGRFADGNGLYLQVSQSASKSWLFRFMQDGRSREMGLGSTSAISLAEARTAALQCQRLLRDGIDPIKDRHERLTKVKAEKRDVLTFSHCAAEYLKAHSASWKSLRHAEIWASSVKRYADPVIGAMPVNAVDRSHIMRVLDPIWRVKTETAKKLRGRLESILDWATVQDYRKGENPARWKGHLDKLLPKPSEVHRVKHFPALPYQEINAFMNELRQREAASARALRLIILTAVRSGELRGAVWSEFNLADATWTIPAERMKAGKEHVIPLSAEAVSILQALPRMASSGYLFTGAKSGRPLSDVVFKKLMERMKRSGITTHGFRSSFRDWAAEQTSFPREVIESALAHQLRDKAEAAYFRSNLLNKRRELMNMWGEYMKKPLVQEAEVIQLSTSYPSRKQFT